MAKKFVKVNGLHNVFEASANIASSTIKSGASASVDANSILFITADADDVDLFGSDYPSMKEGAHYIWAQGVLHDTNSGVVNVGVTGEEPHIKVTGSMTLSGPSFVISHTAPSTGVTTVGKVQTQPKAAGTAGTAGTTGVLKIPTISIDNKGHVSSLTETTTNIPIPNHYKHPKMDVFISGSTVTYDPDVQTDKFIDVDAAINAKITNAIIYRGKEGSTGTAIADGSTTKTVTMSDGSTLTASTGDLIIGRDGIKEFIWNGSIWEQVGSEDRSVVSATASLTSGYEIGKITVNGSTTTFYGKETTVSYTDSSKTGTTYEIGKITINGTTTTLIGRDNDTKYGATNGVALTGGTFFQADLHSYTKYGVDAVAGTSANRYYQVGLDKSGKLAVNVPWQANTNTAHTHSVGVGIGVTGAAKTGNTTNGDCRFYLKTATSGEIGGIAIGYSGTGKNYPVELNSSGQAYVSVPWSDTNTDTNTAHGHTAGEGLTCTGAGGTSGTVTYTLNAAATDKLGGIKIMNKSTSDVTIAKSTVAANLTSGKCYGVELDKDNQAFVYVPWTDTNTNTTYKLTGAVVGTTGSAAVNSSQTTAVASAVSFVDQLRLTSTTGTVDSTSTCILMNGDGVINLKAVAGKTGAIEIDYTGVATAEDWATIG